jgi:hypothetical protein
LVVILPAPLACGRFELAQRRMIPPSNFALRIARYADAASDGGLESTDREALLDIVGQHFIGKQWPRSGDMGATRRYMADLQRDDQSEVERRFLRRRLMASRSNYARHLLLSVALAVMMAIAGCHSQCPGFVTRVREERAAGQQWASDLPDELSRPPSTDYSRMPDGGSM